jgi:hypothetical protein
MAQLLSFPNIGGPGRARYAPAVRAPQTWSERQPAYDRHTIDLYARLLAEEAAGAGADAMARDVLRLDPRDHRSRAILNWHLKRAHGIAETLSPILDW